ncbi:MAG: Uncharacterised protein [Methanobacteriota archaeon]|nr:MAG: Uncharacterised protein [Euryarchaeota archaeon]
MAKLQTVEFSTCLKPTEMVRELREIVVNSGWTYERVESVRTVDRFAIIMPITQLAKSLGIKITSGPYLGLELLCWSHTPGSSGSLHFTSWSFPTKINDDDFDKLIKLWSSKLSRQPWRWTFGERSVIGYFHPVFGKSKKFYKHLGFDVKSKVWPIGLEIELPTVFEEE